MSSYRPPKDFFPMKDIVPTVIGMIIACIAGVSFARYVTSWAGL